MTLRLDRLAAHSDDRGNRIEFAGVVEKGVSVTFRGSNNVAVIAETVRLGSVNIVFDADNGRLEIGESTGVPALVADIRVGQDSAVLIGRRVSSTSKMIVSAAEGTTVTIGDDVMFATGNQVRADDGHPIFDVRTGRRVNRSQDITIGPHVWVGYNAAILAGSTIGEGSVVALGAVVRGRFPNNCVIGGIPARMLRRDIAWERPHTSLTPPYYKPDASTVTKSRYWRLTADPPTSARRARGLLARVARRVGRWVR
jgi:acetyltransferase-like isoleucine patch superfamily enzyme